MIGKRVIAVVGATILLGALLVGGGRLMTAHPPPTPAVIVRAADAHHLLSSSIDARVGRLLQDHFPIRRNADAKLIALSFDDGPYPVFTPLLLDVLHDLDVKATFFLIGDDVEQFPELAVRIEHDGHEIADHTLTHPAHFEALSPEQVREELVRGADVIERYVHDPAVRTMMRPPHGRFTEQTVQAAQQAGFHVVLWNEDVGDWRTVAPEVLAQNMERYATAPDIVLLHSGRLATIEMLPEVVTRFRKAGYTFVTVSELMRRVPNEQILHPLRRPV